MKNVSVNSDVDEAMLDTATAMSMVRVANQSCLVAVGSQLSFESMLTLSCLVLAGGAYFLAVQQQGQ